MTFHDLMNDIKKLIGLPLYSIKEGAEITVIDVNSNRVQVRRYDGRILSRSLSEFEKIFDALNAKPGVAIHVDTVLNGSGSSRNQPETIFAHLPYIEVVYVEAKKHIKLVPEPSHDIGTIRLGRSISL